MVSLDYTLLKSSPSTDVVETPEQALYTSKSMLRLYPLSEAGLMVGFLSAINAFTLILFTVLDLKGRSQPDIMMGISAIVYHLNACIVYTLGCYGSETFKIDYLRFMGYFKGFDIMFGLALDLLAANGRLRNGNYVGISYSIIMNGFERWLAWRMFIFACNVYGLVAIWRQITLMRLCSEQAKEYYDEEKS